MSNKVKLTEITIGIKDGKKIKLSLNEARELHKQLHDLFGDKFIPNNPIIIEPYPWHRPYWYDATYKIETVTGTGNGTGNGTGIGNGTGTGNI